MLFILCDIVVFAQKQIRRFQFTRFIIGKNEWLLRKGYAYDIRNWLIVATGKRYIYDVIGLLPDGKARHLIFIWAPMKSAPMRMAAARNSKSPDMAERQQLRKTPLPIFRFMMSKARFVILSIVRICKLPR
jgi:hypothetical protein